MGVDVEILQPGDGKTFPKSGDKMTMHYTGTLTDGKEFDSSRSRGQPFEFTIGVGQSLDRVARRIQNPGVAIATTSGSVIKGWDEGVMQLSLGTRAKLTCSPDYAYGPRGFPPVIPPNATLVFDVEVLKIN